MPSSDNEDRIGTQEQSHVGNTDFGKDVLNSLSSISQPVEMSDLSSSRAAAAATTEQAQSEPPQQEFPSSAAKSTIPADSTTAETATTQQEVATGITRASEDDPAIGPATERPLAVVRSASTFGPQLVITLLLHSTDTRHPYIINEKYLKSRNVTVADNDPVNLTVYNLKDLIWRDWRDDWETRPASPISIRLIHMGRMLEDKAHLKGDSPHVVHMSVKPQEVVDDEDAKMAKGSTRDRDDHERSGGCRCVIM